MRFLLLFLSIAVLTNCHETVEKKPVQQEKIKNIILMIGDGMGLAQMQAALTVNHGNLNLEKAQYLGLSKTQSADEYETDSGAGGTALSTGHKTNNNCIGLDSLGDSIPTILEIAEAHKLSTGMVVTSKIVHATPASFIAHIKDRNMYKEIANSFPNSGIDIFIGGGKDYFEDSTHAGDELRAEGYNVVYSLKDIDPSSPNNIACLAANDHLPKISEGRGNYLTEATLLALEKLKHNKNGFFLMVEGSQIDWGGHDTDINFVLNETIDFDKAVGAAFKFADENPGTLVIVTADHETGGLSILDGDFKEGTVDAKFADDWHTGIMVPVYAYGTGAEKFAGIYENTAIFDKMLELFQFDKK